jgi:hypothetical protein
VFPEASVSRRYGAELTNSLANLAFISGKTNREIGAKDPAAYLTDIHPERLTEQWVPGDVARRSFREVPRGSEGDAGRGVERHFGLPPYVRGVFRSEDSELPEDDEQISVEEV